MARAAGIEGAATGRKRRAVEIRARTGIHRAGAAEIAAFATLHLRRSATQRVRPLHAEALLHHRASMLKALAEAAMGEAGICAALRPAIARFVARLRTAATIARPLILLPLIAGASAFGAGSAITRAIEVRPLGHAFRTASFGPRLFATIPVAPSIEVTTLRCALGAAAIRLRLISTIAVAETASLGLAFTPVARSVEVATLRCALGAAAIRLRLISTTAIAGTARVGSSVAVTRGIAATFAGSARLRRLIGRSVWRCGSAVVLGERGTRAEREREEEADRCFHVFGYCIATGINTMSSRGISNSITAPVAGFVQVCRSIYVRRSWRCGAWSSS